MRCLLWMVPIIAFAIAVQDARADVIFATGFEPPAYSLGQLAGQDGWTGSSIPVVQSSIVQSGTQAAAFDASLATGGQHLVSHSLSYDSSSSPLKTVTIQEDFYMTSAGTRSYWDVISTSGNGGFIGQLLIFPGNVAKLGLASSTVGDAPVSLDHWNTFDLVLNYQDQVQSAYLNGQFIGSGSFANTNTTLNNFSFGINVDPGTDQAYFDNIAVSAVPEPSSLTMAMASGLVMVGCSRLRRRRMTESTEDGGAIGGPQSRGQLASVLFRS
jgi:hypothetical protein